MAAPRLAILVNPSSCASSQCTVIRWAGSPLSGWYGAGARRVHSRTESGSGSPEATPRVKGLSVILRASNWAALAVPAAGTFTAKASAAAAPVTVRKRRRPMWRAAARSSGLCWGRSVVVVIRSSPC